jgi:hypothetical protein
MMIRSPEAFWRRGKHMENANLQSSISSINTTPTTPEGDAAKRVF